MAARDRAAVGIESRIVGRDAELVAPREHLDRERLVQLEQVDVVERDTRLLEHAPRRRNRAVAHQMRLDAGVREPDETQLRRELQLVHRRLPGKQCGRCAVRETGGVAGGHASARPERGLQLGEPVQRRVGSEKLVARGHLPAVVGEHRHRHDRLPHDAVLPRGRGTTLRLHRKRVRALLRDRGEAVVQILRGLSHHGGRLVDEPLRDEPRVEVDVVAHRVVAHVLDASGNRDVHGAERDLARGRGHGRERARAHAVDRESRHGVGDAGEERDVAPEREPLVADLRGRREHDVADPLRRDLGVPAQELAHDLDAHVVGPRAPEPTFRPGLAERGAHAVDEEDLMCLAHRRATIAAL